MKKITLLLLFVSTIIFSQENNIEKPAEIIPKHEVKLNAFNLIALSSLDVSYEYLINKDASFGISAFYNFDQSNDDIDLLRNFALTAYHRWFFSEKKYARGFFVEAFGMLNNHEDEIYNSSTFSYSTEEATDFGLGISVGGKFISKKNFVAEIYVGVGRNLFNTNNDVLTNNIITRGGISLGYRF